MTSLCQGERRLTLNEHRTDAMNIRMIETLSTVAAHLSPHRVTSRRSRLRAMGEVYRRAGGWRGGSPPGHDRPALGAAPHFIAMVGNQDGDDAQDGAANPAKDRDQKEDHHAENEHDDGEGAPGGLVAPDLGPAHRSAAVPAGWGPRYKGSVPQGPTNETGDLECAGPIWYQYGASRVSELVWRGPLMTDLRRGQTGVSCGIRAAITSMKHQETDAKR